MAGGERERGKISKEETQKRSRKKQSIGGRTPRGEMNKRHEDVIGLNKKQNK